MKDENATTAAVPADERTITRWFEQAVPAPTVRNFDVQLGCHLEEVCETLAAVKCNAKGWQVLMFVMHQVAEDLKKGEATAEVIDALEFLDGLCDQVVTGTGLAHMRGYEFKGALEHVNDSNWSKFEDGKAIFDVNGKIAKSASYFKPNLKQFL